VRAKERVLAQISAMQNMFSGFCLERGDPRRGEGELVGIVHETTENTEDTEDLIRSSVCPVSSVI